LGGNGVERLEVDPQLVNHAKAAPLFEPLARIQASKSSTPTSPPHPFEGRERDSEDRGEFGSSDALAHPRAESPADFDISTGRFDPDLAEPDRLELKRIPRRSSAKVREPWSSNRLS
jgi:hypothetical protein